MPFSLRGTILRKHIATYTAILGIEETHLESLANFLGHSKDIHKRFYRMPVPVKEITDVSRLLQAAMGDEEDENDSDESEDDPNENGNVINIVPRSDFVPNAIPRENSMNASSSLSDKDTTNNISSNHTGNSSVSKRRSSEY